MPVNGVLAEAEASGDIGVTQSFTDKFQHVAFPRGEPIEGHVEADFLKQLAAEPPGLVRVVPRR